MEFFLTIRKGEVMQCAMYCNVSGSEKNHVE